MKTAPMTEDGLRMSAEDVSNHTAIQRSVKGSCEQSRAKKNQQNLYLHRNKRGKEWANLLENPEPNMNTLTCSSLFIVFLCDFSTPLRFGLSLSVRRTNSRRQAKHAKKCLVLFEVAALCWPLHGLSGGRGLNLLDLWGFVILFLFPGG